MLEKKIVTWLKRKGCYPIPDGNFIVFLYEGFWGALLLKGGARSKVEDSDKKIVQKLAGWSYCGTVYDKNWPEIKAELEEMLK